MISFCFVHYFIVFCLFYDTQDVIVFILFKYNAFYLFETLQPMMLGVIMAVVSRQMVKAFILVIVLIMVLDVIEPYFVYGS